MEDTFVNRLKVFILSGCVAAACRLPAAIVRSLPDTPQQAPAAVVQEPIRVGKWTCLSYDSICRVWHDTTTNRYYNEHSQEVKLISKET